MILVRKWLIGMIVLILLMITVGGITRLTGSGLSITEWKPIMGIIPPLNEAEWMIAFQKYQLIPQFKLINSQMTLFQFKWIFFWEFSHRLLGRVIGLAFAIPFLFFWLRGQLPKKWITPLSGVFVLGGLQGALGWFMVKSGLADLSYVSHYRLAAHLLLALLIASNLVWILKRMSDELNLSTSPRLHSQELTWLSRIAAVGILFQTIYGAFTAGLKAGYQFPTFPTMGGEWFPTYFWERNPAWRNLFENPVSVQWIHRVIGTILVLTFFSAGLRLKTRLKCRSQSRALTAVTHLSGAQYLLGVSVVIFGVPVFLGALHQAIGSLLFLATVNLIYEFRRGTSS